MAPADATEQSVGEPRGEPVQAQQPHQARHVDGARVLLHGLDDRVGDALRRQLALVLPPVREQGALVGVEVRLDLAGKDGGHRDPGARELMPQRLGEAAVGCLGGAVDGGPGEGANPGPRGQDHEVAAGPVEHVGERRADRVDGAEDVDPNHLLGALDLGVDERPVMGDAGVGHRQVEPLGPLREAVDGALHLARAWRRRRPAPGAGRPGSRGAVRPPPPIAPCREPPAPAVPPARPAPGTGRGRSHATRR